MIRTDDGRYVIADRFDPLALCVECRARIDVDDMREHTLWHLALDGRIEAA